MNLQHDPDLGKRSALLFCGQYLQYHRKTWHDHKVIKVTFSHPLYMNKTIVQTLRFQTTYFLAILGIALSCFIHASCIIRYRLCVMYINAAYAYKVGG